MTNVRGSAKAFEFYETITNNFFGMEIVIYWSPSISTQWCVLDEGRVKGKREREVD